MEGEDGPSAKDCVDTTVPYTPESTPVPTVPVVTEMPTTGSGSFIQTASVLWAAAMLSVVALGVGAIGIRREDR